MIELFYVEDDPQIADTVKGYLEQKGIRVRICSTLEQARKTLETQIPSLVLLDWNMPDGQGMRSAGGSGTTGRNCRSSSLRSGEIRRISWMDSSRSR